LLNSISPAVFAILDSKRIGVTTWPLGVTWRHRSCDHSIPINHFLLLVLWNGVYL